MKRLFFRSIKKQVSISIIIPCYNQGIYILECLSSILKSNFKDYEIIIVNDGSTDEKTIHILNHIKNPKIKIINQKNKGLAKARNKGISIAQGKYILPLDADDKIDASYLKKAIDFLNFHKTVKIVYCKASFFGDNNNYWDLPPYIFPQILEENCIFCSAIFRKKDWKSIGGYNPKMKYFWEDWDFWLSLIERGGKVYRIPEVLFFYRKHHKSMISNCLDREKKILMTKQLIKNHKKLYNKFPKYKLFLERIYP